MLFDQHGHVRGIVRNIQIRLDRLQFYMRGCTHDLVHTMQVRVILLGAKSDEWMLSFSTD